MKSLGTLVLKFGGAALKDLTQFQKVADIVALKKNEYDKVVVVVSAMEKMTDLLLGLASQIMSNPPKREQDMLVSVGERISMTLLAMILYQRGIDAISFTGSQAGIITCENHTEAKILEVRPKRIVPHLEGQKVVIIAGFQGVSRSGEVTTLGRGGSDTTAVALAIALGALKVEFYKDVLGVFTKDPKIEKDAMLIKELSYQDALEIVRKAKRPVLHPRAIELALKNNIPLFVGSFNNNEMGTLICQAGALKIDHPLFEETLC